MIYLLDIILIFNLYIAYKGFKNILAPPVLMGAGMFLASFVTSCYYEEFQVDNLLLESVLILGFGPMFYTLCCLFQRNEKSNKKNAIYIKLSLNKYRIDNLTSLYFILDILAIACFFLKMYSFMLFFGANLGGSELIGEAKMDASSGDLKFHFPVYIVLMSFIGRTTSFFTCWLLSLSILSKDKNRLFRWLLYLHLAFIVADGITGGTKDAIFDPIFRFAVIFTFLYFSKKSSTTLNRRIVLTISMSFLILFLGFKSLSELIGRAGAEDRDTSDMFAEYLGAEIKNFDIYMHGWDGNSRNKYWGESTFSRFYEEVIPNYKPVKGEFQDIGSIHLGNVYTQWFSFHKDFGTIGVLIMSFIISVVSMFVYNKSLKVLRTPNRPNLSLFIYSSISMTLFMSFFSSRFTQNVFTIFFLRRVIILWLLIYIFEHNSFFVKKKIKRVVSSNINKLSVSYENSNSNSNL